VAVRQPKSTSVREHKSVGGQQKAPTIGDVARRAGVSKSSVSNVILGRVSVTPEVREKVHAAIADLNYRPNAAARQLVRGRSSTVGIVVGELDNPFFAEIATVVEREASLRGLGVMLCHTESELEREIEGLERLLQSQVAGILFAMHTGSGRRVERLVVDQCPAVFLCCPGAGWGDVVTVDEEHGVGLAAAHLIELGHQRLLYLSNPSTEPETDRPRWEGFRAATVGLPRAMRANWLGAGTVSIGRRELAVERLFGAPWNITGICCVNDSTAIELLDCLDRLLLKVPADVSVVGFDDIRTARLARIGLTTIAQPIEALARHAVQILSDRIEGRDPGPRGVVRYDVELIARTTTGPPRAGAVRTGRQ